MPGVALVGVCALVALIVLLCWANNDDWPSGGT